MYSRICLKTLAKVIAGGVRLRREVAQVGAVTARADILQVSPAAEDASRAAQYYRAHFAVASQLQARLAEILRGRHIERV